VAALARRASPARMQEIVRKAADTGVGIQDLSRHAVKTPRAGLVIGYGAIATDKIKEGLRRLRRCFD
jgi:GntR family transcriptional regulator/MocR family aminotransferase